MAINPLGSKSTAGSGGSSAVATLTDTTNTYGIVYPQLSFITQKYQPLTAPDQAVRFASITRYEYNTPFSNSGIGHHVVALNWYSHKGTGNSFSVYAQENKIDNENASATITKVVGSESQLSSNAGTISSFVGHQSRVTGNAGTLSSFTGFNVGVQNTGTINQVIGYDFPDLTATLPTTEKIAFINRDSQALFLSASPIIDQSVTYAAPQETGFTVTIPDNKSVILLTPGAAYAAGTINLPSKAKAVDGQVIEITITQALTSVTWGQNGSAFVLNGPTTLVAGQTVRFRYFAVVDWWVRI